MFLLNLLGKILMVYALTVAAFVPAVLIADLLTVAWRAVMCKLHTRFAR